MERNNDINKHNDEQRHIVSTLFTWLLLAVLAGSSYFYKFPEKSPFNKKNEIELPDSSDTKQNPNQFIMDETIGEVKSIIVQREKMLVDSRFKDSNSINIPTNNWYITINKEDLQNDLDTYKGEDSYYSQQVDSIWNLLWEKEALDGSVANRDQLQAFIASSKPVLDKIVQGFELDQWDYRTKIKKINNFLNITEWQRMQYSLDTLTVNQKLDTLQIRRKPGIGIVNWLLPNWIQWDCEDFSTNFIALAQAAGIPQDYLYIIEIPRHILIWVRVPYNNRPTTDNISSFLDPEGNTVIPIEVTTNGDWSGEPFYRDINPHDIENVRSQRHSRWFKPSEITWLL